MIGEEVVTFINRWEKNRMHLSSKTTWRDQQLGECPYKPKSTLALANGETPSNACTGPACALWYPVDPANREAPGNCGHNVNVNVSIKLSQQLAAFTSMLQQIGGISAQLVKLTAKASPALADDYAEITAAMTAAAGGKEN